MGYINMDVSFAYTHRKKNNEVTLEDIEALE